MKEFKKGVIQANGLEFHYLEAGGGPLALCLHGFPDSPWTYRHLLPELSKSGFRAVAIYMRGYAPTAIPTDGDYSLKTLLGDVNALHEALGGGDDAVLLAHDWGALAAYGALQAEPERWRRAFIGNVPPLAVFGELMGRFDQLKRFFYIWLFQMSCAQGLAAADDLAFIEGLWQDWSPNFDATEEMPLVKPGLRDPENLKAALGYYHSLFNSGRFGHPEHMGEIAELIGAPLTQPTLYIHGTADGCMAITDEDAEKVSTLLGQNSKIVRPEGLGHFFLAEKPDEINPMIIDFLTGQG